MNCDPLFFLRQLFYAGDMSKPKVEFINGMNARAFERVMSILHGEYFFDPRVSQEKRDWWFQNSLQVVQGLAHYDQVDGEMIVLEREEQLVQISTGVPRVMKHEEYTWFKRRLDPLVPLGRDSRKDPWRVKQEEKE